MAMRSVCNYLRTTKKVYKIVDTLARHTKNLYNVGLYNIRQYYLQYREARHTMGDLRPDLYSDIRFTGSHLPYTRGRDNPFKLLSNYEFSKGNENYKILHFNPAQQTLKSVQEAYIRFFKMPDVNRPNYLAKNGRYPVVYLRDGFVIEGHLITLKLTIPFREQHGLIGDELTFPIPKCIKPHQIRQVSLIPIHKGKYYKIEFAYFLPEKEVLLDESKYLSIDLGLNNFVTFVENATGTAVILDGKYLKSINRWFNKEMAKLKSIGNKQKPVNYFSKQQSRITIKRKNKINEAFNRFVDYIVRFAIEHHIGNIVLPKWENIKKRFNRGKINNQNFKQIPHFKFREKLRDKCELYGILFHEDHDEWYTSKTDALAFDEIKEQPYGSSRRIYRGLYQSVTGVLLNADVNAALNHLRKVAGDSPAREIISSGRFNRPVRIRLAYEVPPQCCRKPSHELTCRDVTLCNVQDPLSRTVAQAFTASQATYQISLR